MWLVACNFGRCSSKWIITSKFKIHAHILFLSLLLPPFLSPPPTSNSHSLFWCYDWHYTKLTDLSGKNNDLYFIFLFCNKNHSVLKYSSIPSQLSYNKLYTFLIKLIALCVCYSLSCVWLSVAAWTADHQSSLSVEFSRQGYWSGLPFPSPVDICPDPGIKPTLQIVSLLSKPPGRPHVASSWLLGISYFTERVNNSYFQLLFASIFEYHSLFNICF